MRRRGDSRLRRRPRRLSLPPPGLGSRFRHYVNNALTPQVILAGVVVMILVIGVSSGVAALTGRSGPAVKSGKQTPSSPPPDTPSITVDNPPATSASHSIPLEQYVTYEGETIDGIAAVTGRSAETLLWANTVSEPDKPLPAGTSISIPPVDGVVHLVQTGDTLERIAEPFEIEPAVITGYAPNHVAGDQDLAPGQLILLPDTSVQGRERIVVYHVRPGDNIGVIAGRFGLESNAILSANEMDEPTQLSEGQELIIPPPHSIAAKVKPGDSLNSLAARWGVDPETISTYPGNDISDADTIVAGQTLVIPIEPASGAPDGAGTDTIGTAAANDTAQLGTSQSPSTSGDGATNAPTPAESTAPATASGEPEHARPAAGEQPVDLGPAQEPSLTPSPEAGSPFPAQPSPASAGDAPVSELSPAAHPLGNFIWPAKGTITQRFGPTSVATDPPYAGYAHFHTGLDIANDRGTPVVAADDGIVAFAGWATDGLGYTAKIDHADGFVTWYGHLAEQPSVKPGDQVGKGETLGSMGSTGNSAGPHVHFKIAHRGTFLNPVEHLP